MDLATIWANGFTDEATLFEQVFADTEVPDRNDRNIINRFVWAVSAQKNGLNAMVVGMNLMFQQRPDLVPVTIDRMWKTDTTRSILSCMFENL
jgi:hypothetical protein